MKNIIEKNELKLTLNTRSFVLEYITIKKGITKFIWGAGKGAVNVRPHRPQMLNFNILTTKRMPNNA